MATRFAVEGLRVVLADVEEEAPRLAADGLRAAGQEVRAVPKDVGPSAPVW
jgi:hypothetical protein